MSQEKLDKVSKTFEVFKAVEKVHKADPSEKNFKALCICFKAWKDAQEEAFPSKSVQKRMATMVGADPEKLAEWELRGRLFMQDWNQREETK